MRTRENKRIQNDKFRYPDDSLKPLKEGAGEKPEIYLMARRVKDINRKKFIRFTASVAGLAALGKLLGSCSGEELELDIISEENNCVCHAVCTCNSETEDE